MSASHRALIAACLLLAACTVERPGDLVGTYSVTGALREHTCGQDAFPAADPMVFQVELREDGAQGYWVVQPPPRSGSLSADGAFHFVSESSRMLMKEEKHPEPDPELEADPSAAIDPERFDRVEPAAFCTLLIRESIDGTVQRAGVAREADGGGPLADLAGENLIEVRAQDDTQCDFLLEAQDGLWEGLPCRVRYDIEGARLDSDDEAR